MKNTNKENQVYCENGACKLKKVQRSEENLKDLKNRLSRLIGQLGGVKKMLDDNRYCGDILIQISAVKKALDAVEIEILREHLSSCVVDEIKDGNLEIMDEVVDIVKKF